MRLPALLLFSTPVRLCASRLSNIKSHTLAKDIACVSYHPRAGHFVAVCDRQQQSRALLQRMLLYVQGHNTEVYCYDYSTGNETCLLNSA